MSKASITYYWNRMPGVFVSKQTGRPASIEGITPKFVGTVREWYETLVETIIDVRNALRRDAGRSASAITVRVDIETLRILECSILYKQTSRQAGTTSEGTISDMNVVLDKHVKRLCPIVESVFGDKGTLVGSVYILEG